MTFDLPTPTYTGSEIRISPSMIKMKLKETLFSKAYSFTVNDFVLTRDGFFENTSENINATSLDGLGNYTQENKGKFKVRFAGSASDVFAGEFEIEFNIARRDISQVNFSDNFFASETYTGTNIGKNYEVSFGGQKLVLDTDYTLTYKDNKNVGQATVTVKAVEGSGAHNFKGSTDITFAINPKNIADEDISFEVTETPNYNYGKAISLSSASLRVTMQVGGSTYTFKYATKNTGDFEISRYENNIDAGVATVWIKGVGNFAGERSCNFTILPVAISNVVIKNNTLAGTRSETFTGKQIVLDDRTLDEIAAGEGSYFEVVVNNVEVLRVYNSYVDSNFGHTNEYLDNIHVGRATVNFKLSSNYFDNMQTATFEITPKTYSQDNFFIPHIRDQVKGTTPATPVFTLDYCDDILKFLYTNELGESEWLELPKVGDNGITNYTLSYINNSDYGMATVTIRFEGDFDGIAYAQFEIIKAYSPTDVTITVSLNGNTTITYTRGLVLDDLTLYADTLSAGAKLEWLNGSTRITYVGEQSFDAYYNENPHEYSDSLIKVVFRVERGTFTDADKADIQSKVYANKDQDKFGAYTSLYRVPYFMGLELANVTLPLGYRWKDGEQDKFFTASDKIIGSTELGLNEPCKTYILQAVYDGEENLFGTYDITVKVCVVRGTLSPDNFAKTFYISYAADTYYRDLTFFNQTSWPWSIKENGVYIEGWNEQVVASGEGLKLKMIYNPQRAIDGRPLKDGGFLTAVYGNKQNYNPVETYATIYVSQARYTREEVLSEENVAQLALIETTSYKAAKNLDIATLNVTLPTGFAFRNPEQKLYFGSNTAEVVYHGQILVDGQFVDDPNYQTYGEDLSERITITLNLIAPDFTYYLTDEGADSIITLPNGERAILRQNGDTLNLNGNTVSLKVEYWDSYLKEMVELTGVAEWANTESEPRDEILLLKNGAQYVRSVVFSFDKDSQGILAGQNSINLSVYVKLEQINIDNPSSIVYFPAEAGEEAEQIMGYENVSTLSRLVGVEFAEEFLTQYAGSINAQDVFYEYELWQLDTQGNPYKVVGTRKELLSTDILDAHGDSDDYTYFYKIYAMFTHGSCNNFNFGDYNPTKWLKIHRSNVSFEIANDIEVVYGSIDPMNTGVSVIGIENLNRSDYTLGVFDRNNNRISLSSSTNAGEYTIKFFLNENKLEKLQGNFIFDQEFVENGYLLTKSYKVLKKQISGYTLSIEGVLRQTGERLNDKVSVIFDKTQFVDGNIPSYTLVFRKNGSVVSSVIEQGNYEVQIVFDGDNYEATEVLRFTVLPPDGQHTLVIVAIVLGVLALAGGAIGISVKLARRNMRKNIQKQQMRRIKKELKSLSEKKNNNGKNIR